MTSSHWTEVLEEEGQVLGLRETRKCRGGRGGEGRRRGRRHAVARLVRQPLSFLGRRWSLLCRSPRATIATLRATKLTLRAIRALNAGALASLTGHLSAAPALLPPASITGAPEEREAE